MVCQTVRRNARAEKTLVQKSGYYSRAAAASTADRKLIKSCATKTVQCAFAGRAGW